MARAALSSGQTCRLWGGGAPKEPLPPPPPLAVHHTPPLDRRALGAEVKAALGKTLHSTPVRPGWRAPLLRPLLFLLFPRRQMAMETASFVFRSVTQTAAASSAPHRSPPSPAPGPPHALCGTQGRPRPGGSRPWRGLRLPAHLLTSRRWAAAGRTPSPGLPGVPGGKMGGGGWAGPSPGSQEHRAPPPGRARSGGGLSRAGRAP